MRLANRKFNLVCIATSRFNFYCAAPITVPRSAAPNLSEVVPLHQLLFRPVYKYHGFVQLDFDTHPI